MDGLDLIEQFYCEAALNAPLAVRPDLVTRRNMAQFALAIFREQQPILTKEQQEEIFIRLCAAIEVLLGFAFMLCKGNEAKAMEGLIRLGIDNADTFVKLLVLAPHLKDGEIPRILEEATTRFMEAKGEQK